LQEPAVDGGREPAGREHLRRLPHNVRPTTTIRERLG
jgi:hypothetical protein